MAILTVGSLFSGIGGLDLGLERAGMQVKWQVENDAYCQRVLAKHWPDVERYGDVRECGENLERVDLICGGFPCQPVSCAGQRKGAADDRWLWPEFWRIIRVLRPRWVLAENVPGLLSADAGRLFGGILRDLAASGYDAEWDCIPAAAVGAPYMRSRIVLLGVKSNSNHVGAFENCAGFGQAPIASRDNGGIVRASRSLSAYRRWERTICNSWWHEHDESRICRVADGVPARVDRLRGLGNAVVPAVAEWVGRRIVEVDDRNG